MTKDVTSRDTTGDTTARLRAAFAAHGLRPSTRRPTRVQVDRALDVLGWLHEDVRAGAA